MHQLIPTLKLDLLQTVYNAYVKLGLFKGNPADNLVAKQWLSAIAAGTYSQYPDLNRCLSKRGKYANSLFRYAYTRGAINQRKLSYLLNNESPRKFILLVICDKQE